MSNLERISRYFRRSRIRRERRSYPKTATPTAAVAECTCPEFCERDHDNE
jgi:hypothetical protein